MQVFGKKRHFFNSRRKQWPQNAFARRKDVITTSIVEAGKGKPNLHKGKPLSESSVLLLKIQLQRQFCLSHACEWFVFWAGHDVALRGDSLYLAAQVRTSGAKPD